MSPACPPRVPRARAVVCSSTGRPQAGAFSLSHLLFFFKFVKVGTQGVSTRGAKVEALCSGDRAFSGVLLLRTESSEEKSASKGQEAKRPRRDLHREHSCKGANISTEASRPDSRVQRHTGRPRRRGGGRAVKGSSSSCSSCGDRRARVVRKQIIHKPCFAFHPRTTDQEILCTTSKSR